MPLFPKPEPTVANVVGVVADLKYSKLDAIPDAELYIPYAIAPFLAGFSVVARVDGDPMALLPVVQKAMADVDRTQPIFGVMTLERALADSIAPRRFNLILLGTFAASALLLALIGIYGVIAYAVAQRTHEIGVRMALGAERGDVLRLIVRGGLIMTLAGIVIGLAGAGAVAGTLRGLLFGVEPWDPLTFGVVALVLLATASLACLIPAWRAARIPPTTALRSS